MLQLYCMQLNLLEKVCGNWVKQLLVVYLARQLAVRNISAIPATQIFYNLALSLY